MKKVLMLLFSIMIMFSIACDPAEILVRSVRGETIAGSGQVMSEDRSLPDFDTVELEGNMDVEISKGDSVKCTVEGDDNIIPLLKTEVRGNRLRIYLKRGISLSSYKALNVYLEVPEINGVSVSGSGDISFTDVTRGDVKVSINGSGDLTGTGEAEAVTAEINGSGDMHLFKLFSERASVEINGSGDVEINASASLDAEINGSGDIKYKGNPPEIKRSVNGSGDIAPAE